MAGQTDPDHKLRGDYSKIKTDYTVDQDLSVYTADEHERWRRLYRRQSAMMDRYAVDLVCDMVRSLRYDEGIPSFAAVNALLTPATNWTLVAVPGLLPDDVFFTHLANRRFPVTVWLRDELEFDYIVEPDIFHDFFGHVPLLFDPFVANHLQDYGKGALKAMKLGSLDFLARLYWYTIEFGLINTPKGIRTYGAGILSSGGELPYCIESTKPNRIHLDVIRCMQTLYKIDTFQETYFVIDSFEELYKKTAPDFTPYYEELKRREPIKANAVLQDDCEYPISAQ
jgi:phenylalanine-4-hydroxylase